MFRLLPFLISILTSVLLLSSAASAQQSYRIKSGDQLSIEVLEDNTLNRSVVVLPDGRFSFPFAGSIRAGGRTVADVQSAVTSAISPNFSVPPNVFVSVVPGPSNNEGAARTRTIDVYFLGEVNAPGLIKMERGTTFLQALAQNGGFTRFAAKKRVQLRRTNPRTHQQTLYKVNYQALANGASLNADIVLRDGDVILVPERRLFE